MFWCRKLFPHKLLWMTPRSFGFAGGWQRSLAFHILPLTEQVMHLNAFEASSSAMRRHIGTHRDTPKLALPPRQPYLVILLRPQDGEDHAPTCAMLEHAAEDCGWWAAWLGLLRLGRRGSVDVSWFGDTHGRESTWRPWGVRNLIRKTPTRSTWNMHQLSHEVSWCIM